jgi:hypothetical protein
MNADLREYRELLPICRRLTGVRWHLFVRAHCGDPDETHAHCVKGWSDFGQICIAKADLALTRDGKAATLIHECLHFKGKGMVNHTQKFWTAQRRFLSDDRWLEIAYPDALEVTIAL